MLTSLVLRLLRFYQKRISPLKPKLCRFEPTCSSYSIQSFEKYGFFKGVFYTLRRLLKCHPFHPGGIDPLP